MLAGTEHGISKANIVIGAAKDLDFSLKIKRERMMAGPGVGYNIFGVLETIYIAPDEKGCQMDVQEVKGVGRRLYWPEGGPYVAYSIPERDLLFAYWLPTRNRKVIMPDVPKIGAVASNPYLVDQHGRSH